MNMRKAMADPNFTLAAVLAQTILHWPGRMLIISFERITKQLYFSKQEQLNYCASTTICQMVFKNFTFYL